MSELTFQDPKKKFCAELRAAREYKGLDISRVAEKSKISQPYLERLESGDWDFLPHAYVRAFLRTYALIVGLEVGKVLEQFDNIVDEPPVPVPGVLEGEDLEASREAARKARQQQKKKKKKEEEGVEEGRTPLKFTLAGEAGQVTRGSSSGSSSSSSPLWWIVAAAVIVVVVAVAFWPKGEKKAPVKEIPFEEVVKEHQQDVDGHQAGTPAATREETGSSSMADADRQAEEPSTGDGTGTDEPSTESTYQQPEATPMPADTLVEQAQPGERLELRARAVDRCYIKVTVDADSIPVTDIVLDSGMTRTYEADSLFTVVLGNAAGMDLSLGDLELGVLGEEGRVITLFIGPEGIERVRKGVLRQPSSPAVPDSDTLDLTRPVGAARTAAPGTTGTQADSVTVDTTRQMQGNGDSADVDTTAGTGTADTTTGQADSSASEGGE